MSNLSENALMLLNRLHRHFHLVMEDEQDFYALVDSVLSSEQYQLLNSEELAYINEAIALWQEILDPNYEQKSDPEHNLHIMYQKIAMYKRLKVCNPEKYSNAYTENSFKFLKMCYIGDMGFTFLLNDAAEAYYFNNQKEIYDALIEMSKLNEKISRLISESEGLI